MDQQVFSDLRLALVHDELRKQVVRVNVVDMLRLAQSDGDLCFLLRVCSRNGLAVSDVRCDQEWKFAGELSDLVIYGYGGIGVKKGYGDLLKCGD